MSKKAKKKNPSGKGFKARYIVIPLLLIVLGAGVFGAVKIGESKRLVKVAPVSDAAADAIAYDSGESSSHFYGSLKKGSLVNVKVNPELKIESINFKKGDTVKKGDVLITYETHSLEDSVEDAKLQVKTLTNEISIVENELDILARLQPSENAPQPIDDKEEENDTDSDTDSDSTPDIPKSKYPVRIDEKTLPLIGTGTKDDPFYYIAGVDTVVSKSLLSALSESKSPVYAAFAVCSEDDVQLFVRMIDSSKIDKNNITDFPVIDGVEMTDDGMISFSGSKFDFASFLMPSSGGQSTEGFDIPEGFEIPDIPEIPENVEQTDNDAAPYELSLNDNYMYSVKELREMISEHEKQKASLEFQRRQAELDVKTASYRAKNGGEIASIDGTVTFVAKDMNHLSESGAYITVTNDSTMSVTAAIGEFSLDLLHEGDTVSVTNYEDGGVTNGTVTEISDSPTESDAFGESGSDLESMYQFTVVLDSELALSEETTVDIQPVSEESSDTIRLLSPLVRSEAGRWFVMVAPEGKNTLEKRYVTVGSASYNSLEILDGISENDRIAFPYGKAIAGAAVKDTTYDEMYYNFGLFI